jgi:hypothetical protein
LICLNNLPLGLATSNETLVGKHQQKSWLTTLFVPLFASLTLISSWAGAACEFDQRIYRDAAKQGFTLAFSRAHSDSATLLATVTISHKKFGKLYSFEVSRNNGYGTVYLTDTQNPKSPYATYFFNKNMTESTISDATWLFVEGLGADNYYAANSNTPKTSLLGDTMWMFAGCNR